MACPFGIPNSRPSSILANLTNWTLFIRKKRETKICDAKSQNWKVSNGHVKSNSNKKILN